MNDESEAPLERETLVDRERLLSRLVELVRIPSVGGEEEWAVQRVADWLHAIPGVEVDLWHDDQASLQLLPDYPGHEVARATVPVVAARLRGSRPGPAVLLTGHIDVVPPGDPTAWTREPYSGVLEGDRLFGRGACDMKSGVVAAMEVMEAFAADYDFPGQLIFIAVPGEEDGGIGTFSAIKRGWSADVALIPEPTSAEGRPRLVVAHAGCMILNIQVPGKSAHASQRTLGENALDHYFVIHQALKQHETEINEAEDDPLMKMHDMPYATNVGIVQGGAFASSVMDSLSVDVRVGVTLSETLAQAEERIRGVIDRAAQSDPWLRHNPPVVSVVTRGFGSARTPLTHPLVSSLSEAAEHVWGQEPVPRAAPYGCDMAGWVRLADVPTVLYGPGDLEWAHAADEWVSVDEMERVAKVLTRGAQHLMETQIPGGHGGQAVIPSELPPPPEEEEE
ncbi:MAG TPA: ArgE/DapE family deacylase [Sandaracinaceae bacterium LLY-WYZ-13_1]|nr:ArgE/DapE family deacylase [Sandaracinaceae bacterium LLY-WYZ-13_1]